MESSTSSQGRTATTALPEANAASPLPVDAEFLTRRQVARLFGVSASTVTRWARTGLLAIVRTPGGHYRFRANETRRAAGYGTGGAAVLD
jgi:excisionase family DNA binding protein